jgi:hypothetical protein
MHPVKRICKLRAGRTILQQGLQILRKNFCEAVKIADPQAIKGLKFEWGLG